MSNVRRVYVEKKPAYAVQAKELKHEISSYLGIKSVTGVRVLIRYDVENISDEVFEKACRTVFAEPPVDELYQESFETAENSRIFSVEYLPGQFDQRADSAVQCVQFLDENSQPIIRSATTYVIEGTVTDEEFEAVKHHCINPVDSRETGIEKPETLVNVFPEPEDVKIFDGFQDMPEEELKKLYDSLNLAMTFKDFKHIQVKGLMTIAPFVENPETNREIFRSLRKLSVDINNKNVDNVNVSILSMGMTNDYEVAVEEGATMVRVGTGIFGARNYAQV